MTASPLQRPALNLIPTLNPRAQDALKLFAIACMVADHANRTLNPYSLGFPDAALALFGRLAFPLFALLIAVNLVDRGVAPQKYALPLTLAALVSQWGYQEIVAASSLNVMFTLLIGVAAVALGDWLDARLFKGAGLFALAFAALVGLACDYPIFGTALVPLAVMLCRTKSSGMTVQILAWLLFLAASLLTNLFIPRAYVILALPALLFAFSKLEGDRFLRVPYFGYWFYPAHLIVLVALKGAL